MKPNQDLATQLLHEGLEYIKKPKTYVKGIHRLNKANHKGSFLACYVLGLEMLKDQKLYPADPERSDKFLKKALPFIEVAQEGDPDYYFTRHCLASYYYHGYADVGIDDDKCLEIEKDCAEHGLIAATKFLIEYYSKNTSRDLEKVEHYEELLARQEQSDVEQVSFESSAEDENKEVEETIEVSEPIIVEEEIIEEVVHEDIPLAEKGQEPEVDAHQFFKFDEEDEQEADIEVEETTDTWEKAVDTPVEPVSYQKPIVLAGVRNDEKEEKLAKALTIFENEDKAHYEDGFNLFKEVESTYPIQVNCYLGDLYHEGVHIEQNELKAIHYYLDAERHDSVYASYKLGLIYLYSSSEDTYADKETGLKYLRQAALAGYPIALFELGEIYHFGKTGIINKVAARKFYQLALDRGYLQAKLSIIDLGE